MNRRKLLTWIGLAPFVPVAAKAIEQAPIDDGWVPASYEWTKTAGLQRVYIVYGGGGSGGYNHGRLVCENHPDKTWPDECDCGPGMKPVKN